MGKGNERKCIGFSSNEARECTIVLVVDGITARAGISGIRKGMMAVMVARRVVMGRGALHVP